MVGVWSCKLMEERSSKLRRRGSRGAEMDDVSMVWEVSLIEGVKRVVVRSQVQFVNHSSTPIEFCAWFLDPKSTAGESAEARASGKRRRASRCETFVGSHKPSI